MKAPDLEDRLQVLVSTLSVLAQAHDTDGCNESSDWEEHGEIATFYVLEATAREARSILEHVRQAIGTGGIFFLDTDAAEGHRAGGGEAEEAASLRNAGHVHG